MDLFVVPTIGFDLLMPSSSFGSTAETSSGSTSQQIPRPNGLHVESRRRSWDEAPHYLIRNRDRIMASSSRANCATWHPDKPAAEPRLRGVALPNG